MLQLVITGGQTGADQAAWRAARALGIATWGWMPRGYLTLDGPRPEFARLYGAKASSSRRYADRTRQNVARCEALLWLGDPGSPGGQVALDAARYQGRFIPVRIVDQQLGYREHPQRDPAAIVDWLTDFRVQNLMVGGNRESNPPAIGAWAEAYLLEVFTRVAALRCSQ